MSCAITTGNLWKRIQVADVVEFCTLWNNQLSDLQWR